jgi:polyhydroxybutyrate depolymerase
MFRGTHLSLAVVALLAVGAAALMAYDAADQPERASAAQDCRPHRGDSSLAPDALLHVPRRARVPVPLILAFHGAGGTGPGMAAYSALSAAADKRGFAVLYPSAAKRHFWSLNRAMGNQDIDRLKALLPQALAAACADGSRVFATGVSNGGGFAARAGCELDIAAIAPVAGGYRALDACPSGRRTSVLEIHGTADNVVPYEGKPPDRKGAVARYLAGWARRNACDARAVTHPRRSVTRVRYTGCENGTAVEHLRLAGTDHGWPGAAPPWPRHNPSGIDASEQILRFFASIASPATISPSGISDR